MSSENVLRGKLLRLFRSRAIMAAGYEPNTTLKNKKDLIKRALIGKRRELKDAREIFDEVAKNEFGVDQESANATEELCLFLRKEFPQLNKLNAALILLGSSVHAGKLIRKAFSSSEKGDIDLAMITDSKITDAWLLEEIGERTRSFLKNKKLQMCHYFNPGAENLTSLKSVDEALKLLLSSRTNGVTLLLFYFYPSYPPSTNQQHRELISQALRELSNTKYKQWLQICRLIMERWSGRPLTALHIIKEKHLFVVGDDIRSHELAIGVSGASATMMSTHMRRFLLATNKNRRHPHPDIG